MFAAFFAAGVFAAYALALAAYRFSRMDGGRKADSGDIGALAEQCVENSSRMTWAIPFGRKLFFSLGAAALCLGISIALEGAGIEISRTGTVTLILFSALAALFLEYALADIPLAAWGRQHPVCALRRISPLFYAFYLFFLPLESLSRNLGHRVYRKKTKNLSTPFDYMDVAVMLHVQDSDIASISPYTGKILKNALRLQNLDVSDIMLPRSKVVYLDTESSAEENISLAEKTRHTRYPLCKGDLDNCYGIVNIKNIFSGGGSVDLMSICRETLRIKETEKLDTALSKMLKYRLQMALVEDDFGGVIGVITLDAALSELVGKIRDEFDRSQDQSIRVTGKNKYLISGLASLHRVEDFLDVDFDNDEVSTFGGLITFRLGRFPEKGERLYFEEQKLRVRIESVGERAVRECSVQFDDLKEGGL